MDFSHHANGCEESDCAQRQSYRSDVASCRGDRPARPAHGSPRRTLVGCTDNSSEEPELATLTDAVEAYERQRWAGRQGSPAAKAKTIFNKVTGVPPSRQQRVEADGPHRRHFRPGPSHYGESALRCESHVALSVKRACASGSNAAERQQLHERSTGGSSGPLACNFFHIAGNCSCAGRR